MKCKSVCLLLLIFCTYTQVQSVEDDDDFDGVTVEDEVSTTSTENGENEYDVPYESPEPSDKSATYFAEHFDSPQAFERRWIRSQAKKEGIDEEIAKYDGLWKIETPKKDGLKGDMGLVLKSKAKHSAIAAKLDRPFNFRQNRPLIVQYEVTLQEGQECGGAYLKLLSEGAEPLAHFHDKTQYSIMFGPDKCGNDHKLHFIFKHRNPLNGSLEEKHCKKPKERLEDVFKDKLPHLYTLIVKPDNKFEVWIDQKIVNHGTLLEDFTPPVNPPAEIDDPTDKKPADWDDQEKIPDPEATKPDDWDESAPATIPDPEARLPEGWLEDEPPMIPDPDARQPEDWDADMDGEWEPPLIDNPVCRTAVGCGKWVSPVTLNPNYKGKWHAPLIDNPNYKGKWRPRRIPNPDYFEDLYPFYMSPIHAVGFELWSMSPDILFDNLIITDQVAVAEAWAAQTFHLKRKKIARESGTVWGRMMKSMNYKPGWWALYFVYCTIPIGIYVWYIRKRVLEESFIQRMLMYTEEYPWLWLVYVVAVGFPLVLLVYCCCRVSDKKPDKDATDGEAEIDDKEHPEKEEAEQYDAAAAAASKKTDAYTKDDEPKDTEEPKESEEPEKETSDVDDKDNEPERVSDENNDENEEDVEAEPQIETVVGGGGDVARKRKPRKE